jgi:serine protease Do
MASFEPQDFGLDEPPPRPDTPPVRRGFVLVLLVLCFMAALVYGIPIVAERTGYAWESGRSKAAIEALDKLDKAGVINRSELFRLATVAVSPAVVNIQTKTRRRDSDAPGLGLGGGGNRFGNEVLEDRGIGSGVVIDKDNGYIVTNNHVIQGAEVITVRLSQGSEIPARLVGHDSKTDLAVLQIKAPVKVAAEWGDSDKLAPGDWVLAIGSPYMLDHTVTAGIISATGRNNLTLPGMDEGSYQDFLQTDAAINPGNSGGPLIDLSGKIVGINTAILTANSFLRGGEGIHPTGGFEGIGLAIPSSMARKVVDGLIRDGKVVRGFLGVGLYPRPIPREIVQELKLKDSRGALITHVQPGSPADRAGLKPRDVVVKLGAKEIADYSSLRIRTAELTPGDEVPLEYYREGKLEKLKVVIGDQSGPSSPSFTPYGFRVIEIAVGPKAETALVFDLIAQGTPAARAGIQPGYRLLAVGQTKVYSLDEFNKAAAAYSLERGIPLVVQSPDGQTAQVVVGGPVGGAAPR